MATIGSLIIDVIANTATLQKDVEEIKGHLNGVSDMASKMASALGIAFSATAVVSFAKQIVDFAGEMSDLAVQTGIGVEQLQALNYVGSASGVTVEQIASAVAKLSKGLLDGNDGAVEGLKALHLSMSDILDATPDEAFLKIASAIGEMEDPWQRAHVAMQLFGKSGAELLPLMTDDIRHLMTEARQSNAIIKEGFIEDLDALGDKAGQAYLSVRGLAAGIAGGLWESMKTGADESAMFTAELRQQAVAAEQAAASQGALAHAIELAKKASIQARELQLPDIREMERQFEKEEAAREKARAAQLRAAEAHQKEIERAQKARNDFDRQAGQIEIEQIVAVQDAWVTSAEKSTAALQRQQDYIEQWQKENEKALKAAAMASEEWERAVHDDMARNEHAMLVHKTTINDLWHSLFDDVGSGILDLMDLASEQFGGRFEGIVKGLTNAWHNGRTLMKGIGELMTGDFSNVIGTMMAGIQLVKSAWSALKGLFSNEVEHANDTRDQFFAQFGGGEGLAALLTSLGAGDGGGDLYHNAIGAASVDDFNSAKSAIEQFLHNSNHPGFATGTFGQFLDFGAGTTVRLHGRERVETEAEGRFGNAMVAAALNRLAAAVERQSRVLPGAISDAVALAR